MNGEALGGAILIFLFSVTLIHGLLKRRGEEPSFIAMATAIIGLVISVVGFGLLGLIIGASRAPSDGFIPIELFVGLFGGLLVGYIFGIVGIFLYTKIQHWRS